VIASRNRPKCASNAREWTSQRFASSLIFSANSLLVAASDRLATGAFDHRDSAPFYICSL
jgi:hypothetical protein